MATKEMEKTVIGHRTDEYERFLKLENELKELCGALETKAKEILGVDGIDDFVSFMSGPYDYLINDFFRLYGGNEAPHIDRERFALSKVTIDKREIDALAKRIGELLKLMQRHRPSFTPNGMKWNLEKSSFDMILDESKRDEYELVKKFVDTAIELRETYGGYYSKYGDLHGFHPGVKCTLSNQLIVDPYKFYAK